MALSRDGLEAESALTGFRPELLEKVAYLRPQRRRLTDDVDLAARVRRHPDLLWKAMNVKKHFGLR